MQNKKKITKWEPEDELSKKLAGFDETNNKIKERDSLKSDLALLAKRKTDKDNEAAEIISENIPYVFIRDNVKDYIDAINVAVQKHEMPPSIPTTVFEEILHSNKCICNRELSDDAIRVIKELLSDSSEKEKFSFLARHNFSYTNMERDMKNARKLVENIDRELVDIDAEMSKKNNRLTVLEKDLESSNAYKGILSEDPRLNLKDIRNAISKNSGDIALKKSQITQLESVITENKQKIEKLISNDGQNNVLKKKILKLNYIEMLLGRIEAQILKTTREKIQDGITETYKKLHWKKEIDYVGLSDDYVLDVVKTNGEKSQLQDLSNGEKKMLGISVINALSKKLENFDFPFFIDSPTEELDGAVVPKVLDNLQNLASDKQVFVMTLHKPEVDEFLKKIPSSNKYQLVREDSSINVTSIIKEER